MTRPILSDEETQALQVLLRNRRLMVIVVPEEATDSFVWRLTVFSNYCLDTKLVPPLHIPAARAGDGLHCPYCNAGIKAGKPWDLEPHKRSCEWRQAAERWAYAHAQIDEGDSL